MIKQTIAQMTKHPISALYGALLLFLALRSSVAGLFSGTWDAAAVDLAMAVLLIFFMFKHICTIENQGPCLWEKLTAWGMLAGANLLMLLPESSFSGNLLRSFSFVLLLTGSVLFFSNWKIALHSLPAALWCCIFIPFHEEIMLMASYPLRLSATMLAAVWLKICGTGVICSGTSLHLPHLNIAITDACSGINQLDAFLLIAFIAVKIMHGKGVLQLLHFAFIVPAIIIANSLRIGLTVLLFKMFGEVILGKFCHISLGYVQIIIALVLFIAVGKLLSSGQKKTQKAKE